MTINVLFQSFSSFLARFGVAGCCVASSRSRLRLAVGHREGGRSLSRGQEGARHRRPRRRLRRAQVPRTCELMLRLRGRMLCCRRLRVDVEIRESKAAQRRLRAPHVEAISVHRWEAAARLGGSDETGLWRWRWFPGGAVTQLRVCVARTRVTRGEEEPIPCGKTTLFL